MFKLPYCGPKEVGNFFCDNAVYSPSGEPVLSGKCTESCQYYAFFTDIATPELYPELWETLLADFGPERKQTKKWAMKRRRKA